MWRLIPDVGSFYKRSTSEIPFLRIFFFEVDVRMERTTLTCAEEKSYVIFPWVRHPHFNRCLDVSMGWFLPPYWGGSPTISMRWKILPICYFGWSGCFLQHRIHYHLRFVKQYGGDNMWWWSSISCGIWDLAGRIRVEIRGLGGLRSLSKGTCSSVILMLFCVLYVLFFVFCFILCVLMLFFVLFVILCVFCFVTDLPREICQTRM